MTYTSLPNSGQSLGQTRAQIKNNFDLIKTSFDQNHVDFDLANFGKHYCIQMPVTASIPAIPLPPLGLVAGDANLYSKNSSAASQIFYSPDASGNEYQMTRAVTASYALFGLDTANYNGVGAKFSGGWTFLPGGLLYQYGKLDNGGSLPGGGTITFPVAFTGVPYNIQITLIGTSSSGQTIQVDYANPPTSTIFKWLLTSSVSSYKAFYWTAIGL